MLYQLMNAFHINTVMKKHTPGKHLEILSKVRKLQYDYSLILAQKRKGSTSAMKTSADIVIPIRMFAFRLKSSILFSIALAKMF